ncbi:MAG: sodium ion-translocating decarboxylase subunit beta [Desulfobacula sp.]|jgi:oxaloacetate decarboxylase beta subunit|uniref:sodium ion-translocating decarboxylase subunit beta n=1 Tax=Desulfobacula sp. TaxID=2593537 RepID=UPI001D8EDD84|nr:sodium ion-translocating decarboxylase subunit beta [Desulfobacula sp.]MBT3486971.1 sodium ion-translocating decarboxylase subunit beta [Desulfobacula sp.]MBT3806561.1 sodium ion-translocating decarboxylase subunit beta [Desulfobacula sp.]MBT4026726.1 sodium ion-translocating decarboxylase subunit beta [Desulfobacula sp.]MBT4199019.1 sodium ion-translocating decarboxylase subunit beta [Desulfobacula sp.]
MELLLQFLSNTGFYLADYRHFVMLAVGSLFVYLAIAKKYEPLLLLPIGFGVLIGNIPFFKGFGLGIYEPNSVLHYLYFGVTSGLYPSIVFLGLGAMTDFSSLLARPKLMLLGAAAQTGIWVTLLSAMALGFMPKEAASIAIIGGADGPTSIFLTAKLAPHLIGPIAIAAYSYMALIPIIQPPIMRLLTTRKERLIHMPEPRDVSKKELMVFPVVGLFLCCFLAPASIPLLGPFFFGNIMKESGVVDRLANTARTSVIDTATIFLGLTVGASTQGDVFLTTKSVSIFLLGAVAFSIATASGIVFAKIMNLFMKEKINPLLGAAGVSAVPGSAREVHLVGLKEDPTNFLLMHAMACNSSGVIGSAICAGILWSFMM